MIFLCLNLKKLKGSLHPLQKGLKIQSLHVFAKINLFLVVIAEVTMLKEIREGQGKGENEVIWNACHYI